MPKWLQWLGFLVSGIPPDDLRPMTIRTWRAVMVVFCAAATVFVVVALLLGVRPD
jgi:hypothetical protein